MKTVTISAEVHELLQEKAFDYALDEGRMAHLPDGSVTFEISDETADRLSGRYPGLTLSEAIERALRGDRLQ